MSMDLGDEHPGLALSGEISKVVEKLRDCLSNNSNYFKGTLKKLDVLEDKLLRLDNLQQVKPHKEEAASAWLRLLKKATNDAKELLDDMESEANECKSSISDVIMTWRSSDNRNLIRMAYIIGKLVSVCADAQSLHENASEDEKNDKTSSSHDAMSGETKYLLDDDFLIGRDKEIAMIRDMVLDNAQYVAVAASLEGRAEADKLHISQKGWIIETLQNIDQSKKTQEAAEHKEMGYKVEYTRLANVNTDTNLQNPTVIPIVGISGVGKSALARFVFKDESVREHFGDQSAWVYMTDRISQEEMIKQIVFSFSPEHVLPNLTIDLKDVHTVLQSIIEGKRFFLVLDDVWDEIRAIWSGLRSVLSKGAPGSVVLVTTQLYGVASSIGTTGPIVLDRLQYDDSWALLKQYSFADLCSSQSMQAFEPIGRKVTDRLHGLPLAIKVIGASLRNNFEESHWEKLLEGWWWNFSDDNLCINIIPSLGSSYSVLPGYLRQCFAYFSIFPRNYVFEKNKLVLMWIANGFIHLNSSTSASRLEDIAGRWFDELVSRAFLQPSVWKAGYVMHNLVRDFAVALSSNEYHGIDSKLRDASQICHLSIEMDDMNVQLADFNKNLRTLLSPVDFQQFSSGEAYYLLDSILKSSTSLRLLDFSSSRWSAATTSLLGCQAQDNCEQYSQRLQWSYQISPPDAISGLRHLRHLDLSFTGINALPNSFCTLHHIQVLGLRGCKFKMLPVNMNTMTSLRHLHADVDTTALIYGIGKLTELQELEEFCVEADDGHRITELRDLSNIRGSLCISNLNMVADREEALKANLFTKHYLTSLYLKWDRNSMVEFDSKSESKSAADIQAEETFSGLSFPKHMQELKVSHYPGCAFPDWAEQLKHIQFVEITSCQKLKVLPPLGQLEHLHKLKLHKLPSIKDINSESYGMSNVVFKSLAELSFEDMQNWENWTDAGSREFIPNLQKLRIIRCDQLKKVPFESLSSATKEMVLDGYGGNAHMISRYLTRLTRLEILDIWGVLEDKLILPCEQLRSLEYLHIYYFGHVRIKGGLWYIRNLKDLRLAGVDTVTTELDEESPHEEKHDPTQSDRSMHYLSHLHLDNESLPTDLNIILSKTPSLRTLCLDNIWQLTSINEQWFQQRTSLRELELSSCHILPSLASLSSLKKLSLKNCRIYSIQPNSLPGNLKEMEIEMEINGPRSIEFEARLQNPNGEVWPKEKKMDQWQRIMMMEWLRGKMEYGRNKLIETQSKKEQERLGLPNIKLLTSAKGDSLSMKSDEGFSSIEEPLKSAKWDSLWMKSDEGFSSMEEPLKSAKGDSLRMKREEGFSSIEEPLKSAKEDSLRMKREEGFSNIEEPLKSAKEDSLLGEEDKWLQQSDGNEWPGRGRRGDNWLRKKLEEALLSNKEGTSNLKKEREEWLKKEQQKWLELRGMDWPKIAHVPYIRVNGEIVQNLYT